MKKKYEPKVWNFNGKEYFLIREKRQVYDEVYCFFELQHFNCLCEKLTGWKRFFSAKKYKVVFDEKIPDDVIIDYGTLGFTNSHWTSNVMKRAKEEFEMPA